MLGIIYQMYYMATEQCSIQQTFNDIFLFCWNQGCNPDEVGLNFETNFLYMTRDIIDAAIVWYEGIPDDIESEIDQWHELAMQTGDSVAGIINEFIAFEKQENF